jgi:hypothetical protein
VLGAGKSVADMSYAETLDLIRAAGRPLMLRFHAARRVTKETAGTVTNCAVVGSRLVEASGFFSRPHTVYCVVATTSEGIFSAELRFSDVCGKYNCYPGIDDISFDTHGVFQSRMQRASCADICGVRYGVYARFPRAVGSGGNVRVQSTGASS